MDLTTSTPTSTPAELMRAERAVARRHMNHFPWGSLVWAVLNLAVWLALWPLTLGGHIPLWATLLVASANVALGYLPSHEAQHDIFARPGSRGRWLNELVGHASLVPLAVPFHLMRATHLEHHKHTNDPALDPDFATHADTPLGAVLASIRFRRPRGGQEHTYRAVAERLGRDDLVMQSALVLLVFYGILFAGALSGFALEMAVLWWLPRHIGSTYIHFFLSWAPHNPGMVKGRYRDTRGFKSRLGVVGSLGMEAHVVHHLHPRIPLLRTPRAMRELRPVLHARGVRMDGH